MRVDISGKFSRDSVKRDPVGNAINTASRTQKRVRSTLIIYFSIVSVGATRVQGVVRIVVVVVVVIVTSAKSTTFWYELVFFKGQKIIRTAYRNKQFILGWRQLV